MTKKGDNVIKVTRFFTKVCTDDYTREKYNVKNIDFIIELALVEPDYIYKEYRVCIMHERYHYCDYYGTVASGTLNECKKIYKELNNIEIMKKTLELNYFEFLKKYC